MDKGKILVGQCDGNYLIKMTGDVRVTLCASLNQYINTIFKQQSVQAVLVDLLDAEGLDSTTLGLLAKLALHSKRVYGIVPRLFCSDRSILKTLEVMALDELFEIIPKNVNAELSLRELGCCQDEERTRADVLEAHKLLVEINPKCEAEFIDLIRYLENEVSIQ
ncbi:MAG: anti-sigma factor antagonist [Gammaproteobacteria bacterium]|nr:MAG: anti-sigma factor antagonist [Gammaproteobacteria bacterium]